METKREPSEGAMRAAIGRGLKKTGIDSIKAGAIDAIIKELILIIDQETRPGGEVDEHENQSY